MATARAAVDRFIPNSPRIAVGADGGLLDRDEALHVAPGLVHERALDSRLPVVSRPTMAGVRGQVDDLLVGPEHDLDLLDRAPVAVEAVVDPAADDPAAELGEGPAQVGALADDRVAMLEDGRRRRAGPGCSRPRGGRRAPRSTSSVPVNRLWGTGSPSAHAIGGPDATSSSTRSASAPAPRRTIVRVTSARSGAPAAQRTMTGWARRTPSGTTSRTPWLQKPRDSWASLSSAGSARAALEESARRPSGRGRAPRRTSRASRRPRAPRRRAPASRPRPRAPRSRP